MLIYLIKILLHDMLLLQRETLVCSEYILPFKTFYFWSTDGITMQNAVFFFPLTFLILYTTHLSTCLSVFSSLSRNNMFCWLYLKRAKSRSSGVSRVSKTVH